MPVSIKRARPRFSWSIGEEFSARSTSGTRYRFRLVNVESLIAIDVHSGRTWWVSADRKTVRMAPAGTVTATIEEE